MRHDDPAHMSVDDRLDQLASLPTAGLVWRKRRTGYVSSATSATPFVSARLRHYR